MRHQFFLRAFRVEMRETGAVTSQVKRSFKARSGALHNSWVTKVGVFTAACKPIPLLHLHFHEPEVLLIIRGVLLTLERPVSWMRQYVQHEAA